MAELRSVDPRGIKLNPNNPRRTPAPAAMDEQLLASIQAIGIVQPPVVRERDGDLVVKAGDRRVKAAIKAGLATIDVIVSDADESHGPMQSLSENLIRALTSVDIWRATETLVSQGWSEQAIADALALPARTVKRLGMLAHLHSAMLDFMAQGSMPNEDELRTIAAASRHAIGASLNLPNTATEEFLSCLSKAGIGKAATTVGVRVEARAKDIPAGLVERFKDGVYVNPIALSKLTQAEIHDAKETAARRYLSGRSWDSDDDPTDGLDEAMEGGEGAEGDEAPFSKGQDFAGTDASAMADGDRRKAPVPPTAGTGPFSPHDDSVMTHVTPVGGGTAASSGLVIVPSASLQPPAPVPLRLDREQIRDRIAQHRGQLAELEGALVAACEAVAARCRTSAVRVEDRATWDRAMWQSYLEAATVLEPEYGPRLRDLLRDIDRLERLLALPIVCESVAR